MRKKKQMMLSAVVVALVLVVNIMFMSIKACAEPLPEELPNPPAVAAVQEEASAAIVKQVKVSAKVIEDLNESCENGETNKEKLFNYLVYKGYSKEASAGIIGNLMFESGGGKKDIKLNAVEKGSGEGIGMVQWSFGRKQNFIDYCDECGVGWPNESLKVQADFLLKELEGDGMSCQWCFAGTKFGYDESLDLSYDDFKGCSDVALATQAFCANFERCKARHASMETRISYAKQVYNDFAK